MLEMIDSALTYAAVGVLVLGFLYFAISFVLFCNQQADAQLKARATAKVSATEPANADVGVSDEPAAAIDHPQSLPSSDLTTDSRDVENTIADSSAETNTQERDRTVSELPLSTETDHVNSLSESDCSLDGVRRYTLHGRTVVRVSDVKSTVPDHVRRYTLHSKKVVRVEDLQAQLL
ncbi:hypothetical protein NIES2135_61680 (plasmid) [Leptolyngbya boryana NIES-2135]|jgi:hypothetical protein|uniref:Uncharacterized protein n=1 Tax=Leptolyngbya boryana NIES-2135 TaxID=1973484 RepID=A0A1Z4JR99_LEPBY|nr:MULTISPECIES: OadG family protein [Leptolyngbya]BAY59291.1 hypothetical protein NIES2135_61680 [Leptolyngbya boryana NIES-2135]MBD2372879.1 OadG family protein [Leptolyngbya sp. FACHB-238]MBD2397368.1 OadG family protein [Leptolyngbya sp. FACHB-239]MBD2403827.1 OadG family protein [Leptolyngbya sp. FACHB-402]ULP33483.1 OadG family protein [Leptolyngbya boryana IU 594]